LLCLDVNIYIYIYLCNKVGLQQNLQVSHKQTVFNSTLTTLYLTSLVRQGKVKIDTVSKFVGRRENGKIQENGIYNNEI